MAGKPLDRRSRIQLPNLIGHVERSQAQRWDCTRDTAGLNHTAQREQDGMKEAAGLLGFQGMGPQSYSAANLRFEKKEEVPPKESLGAPLPTQAQEAQAWRWGGCQGCLFLNFKDHDCHQPHPHRAPGGWACPLTPGDAAASPWAGE